MKKLLIVLVLALMASGVNAQAKKAQPHQPVKKAVAKSQVSTDFYTVQEGRVVLMKGNAMNEMTGESVKFPNGNILMKEGTLIYDNGANKMMLEPGQHVDMKGNIGKRTGNNPAPGEETPDKKQ